MGDELSKVPGTAKPQQDLGIPGLKGLDEAAGKALSPAAEGFGKEIVPLGQRAGQLTNRVGSLLIRALEPLVYGLEKSADWIEKAVTERLKDIPQEKIVPPNARIAVPALQALTYSMDDELIREMFANLLAADMNSDKKEKAHPAFVELIKEMTPIDARVLRLIRDGAEALILVRLGTANKFLSYGTHYTFSIEGVSDSQIGTSLNNLERLGLLERRDEFPLRPSIDELEEKLKKDYEPTLEGFNQPDILKSFGLPPGGKAQIICKRQGIYMNPLGDNFAQICLVSLPKDGTGKSAS